MKKSSEIRANARFDLYQNMGALFKLYGVSLLLTVLISFVLQLLVNALSLQEGSLLEELISSLIAFLVAWLLAPYTIGANRQLLEMEQGGTPSYQKAWAWFRQGAWNRNASSLVFIIQAWALALTLASKLFDLFLWPLVFSVPFSSNLLFQDLSIANVLSLPTLASSLVASRGSLLLGLLLQLAVAILVQLVLLLFLFAPYLQAADPLRPPKECLRAGIALAKEHFWPLVGMFLVLNIQMVVFLLVVLIPCLLLTFLPVLGVFLYLAAGIAAVLFCRAYLDLSYLYFLLARLEEKEQPLTLSDLG